MRLIVSGHSSSVTTSLFSWSHLYSHSVLVFTGMVLFPTPNPWPYQGICSWYCFTSSTPDLLNPFLGRRAWKPSFWTNTLVILLSLSPYPSLTFSRGQILYDECWYPFESLHMENKFLCFSDVTSSAKSPTFALFSLSTIYQHTSAFPSQHT